MWRLLLTGKPHVYFANYIVSVFHNLLSVCESYGIVSATQSNQARLNVTNINDLSDAVKLITTRFDTVLLTKSGRKLTTTLPSAIQTYIHSDTSNSCSRADIEVLRKAAYQGLQFEVICKQISYSRNLNAHSNLPVEDLGHASMLASAFLRLQELFEPPTESIDILQKMNQLCCFILEQAVGTLSVKKSQQRAPAREVTDKIIKTDDALALTEGSNGSDKNDLKEDVNATNPQSSITETDYPIQYDGQLQTWELKKQRLLTLRKELLKFMAKEMEQVRRSKCILTNQSINELLSISISGFEDISTLPSFSYNFEANREVAERQYVYIESQLLDILRR